MFPSSLVASRGRFALENLIEIPVAEQVGVDITKLFET